MKKLKSFEFKKIHKTDIKLKPKNNSYSLKNDKLAYKKIKPPCFANKSIKSKSINYKNNFPSTKNKTYPKSGVKNKTLILNKLKKNNLIVGPTF